MDELGNFHIAPQQPPLCLFLPTSARMFSPPISLVIFLSFLYPRFYDLWKAQLIVKVG